MDLLRNNAKLEQLYSSTVTRAYEFCLTYRRTAEFKKLADILRTHVLNLIKYKDSSFTSIQKPDVRNPQTADLYMKNRIRQLEVRLGG